MKFILFLGIIFNTSMMFAQHATLLYPKDQIPNSIFSASVHETQETRKDGLLIISNVVEPRILVFAAPEAKATGTAMIIFPGGGYNVLAACHEGTDVAKAFNQKGITAFVVLYRLPDARIMTNPALGPLQDAQRAIQLVRERAAEWKINPGKIGIIGFSAGGHLASSAGTKFSTALIANPKGTSLRPDFMVLVYPVISADSAISHKGSFAALLGEHASHQELEDNCNEKNITNQTPPTFLLHASDDVTVPSENSIVFYNALLKHHVPAELHLYQAGGHGFGLTNSSTADRWMERLENWMKANGL